MLLFFKFRPLRIKYLLKCTKFLEKKICKTGGRTKNGNIVSFKKSKTPFRKLYKFIDFWRRVDNFGYIVLICYDSIRTSYISLICYKNGYIAYNLSIDKTFVGNRIFSGENFLEINKLLFLGNTLPLKFIPVGTIISSIELWFGKGSQLCRAAGTSAVIIKKFENNVFLKLRSGWKILISENCYATIGCISNINHMYNNLNKAGKSRNLGRNVTVRGVAMNAVDHPHGGGRGKTSGDSKSFSPWGKVIKGRKTVIKLRN